MPQPPNNVTAYANADSEWAQTYTFTQFQGGPPIDLTGLTFQFVVRPNTGNAAEPALVSVISTGSTSQGSVSITPLSGIVSVTLTPAATALLGQGAYAYALWSSPGTNTQNSWVYGNFISRLVAVP